MIPRSSISTFGSVQRNANLGQIHFWRNFSYDIEGKPFLRASHDCNMEDVCTSIMQDWKIPTPRIALLLISNVAPLTQWTNIRQIRSFLKGLLDAANTTDMWILTNGVNIGIAKLVGDAIQEDKQKRTSNARRGEPTHQTDSPVILIGIAREDLLNHADMFRGKNQRVELENEGNRLEDRKFDLNPNHSHFLVVKDNTINKNGINYFLLRLQAYLTTSLDHPRKSSSKSLKMGHSCLSSMEIPVVAMLFQGGPDSCRLVLDHLRRKFPLVVMQGTGGLADILGFANTEIHHRTQGMDDAEYLENYLKPELSRKIAEKFPNLQDNISARNIFRDRILSCLRFSKQNKQAYMTVINLFEHSCDFQNLSNILLRSLFSSQKPDSNTNWYDKMQKDLYLTIDWNNPDMAMAEVFQKDPSNKFKVGKDVFEEALLRANRESFVDLILNQGFQVHKYLTPWRLGRLFKKILKQEFFLSVCWEGILGYGPASKIGKDFVDKDLNTLIAKVTKIPDFVESQQMSMNAAGMYIVDPSTAERKAKVLLTFWATFAFKIPLVKVLWKHSDQPIRLALILSMMIQEFVPYAKDSALQLQLEESSGDFADIATSMLDASYKDSPTYAFDVLNEENAEWDYSTAVDIAAQAHNRKFLSHVSCQKWLTNEFYGKIRIRQLSWGIFTLPNYMKILLSAFLIFPMYTWILFKTDENADLEEEKEFFELEPEGEADNLFLIHEDNILKNKGKDNKKDESCRMRCNLSFCEKIYFVWSSPITKFWTFQAFYVAFLTLFSVAVMWPSCGNPLLDMIVCPWMALIALESIHPIMRMNKKRKSTAFFSKLLEMFLMAVFVTLYALGRLVRISFLTPYSVRVILCLELLFYYYRIIAIFLPISPTLGPLLYRVKLMVLVDFVNFMRMALLVIISGGIVIHAVMYPDYPFDKELFRRTFHKAWFSLFMTPVNDLTNNEQCSMVLITSQDETDVCMAGQYHDWKCANVGFWAYLFHIQYFVLLKLILLTLLYALFSATASKLSAESDAIWKFQRYHLVVDFSNRLMLPAPLNAISYIIIVFEAIACILECVLCYPCRKCKNKELITKSHGSTKDYSYWNQLAQEYCTKEQSKMDETKLFEKHVEMLQNVLEDFKYQKQAIHQLKGIARELERQMNYSNVYLENISHQATYNDSIIKKWEVPQETMNQLTRQVLMNILSRRSPYPSTKVQRYPVADRHVPWDVMWTSYDPIVYTQSKTLFQKDLQPYVDEDILLMQEKQNVALLPEYNWNSISVNPAGISIDRQSWTTANHGLPVTYSLDSEKVPLNPMGRTGLRGCGSLPRWGPNHYVLTIITRFQRPTGTLLTNKGLEFVVFWTEKRAHMSIPGAFVSGEHRYEVIRRMFKTPVENVPWKQATDLIQFFRNCISTKTNAEVAKVECTMVYKGYMDDSLNTDNAWKEVELWHIHFNTLETVVNYLQPMMGWRLITEDVFFKLPSSQAVLLQDIAKKMKAVIF